MDINVTHFLQQSPIYILIFIRISAALMTDVIIGASAVPRRFKMLLAVLLTMTVSPLIETPTISLAEMTSAFMILEQILIGISIGIIMKLVFQIAVIGGQLTAYQTGLGFAELIDPHTNHPTGMISELYFITTLLLFLVQNGHLRVIEILISSFDTFPLHLETAHTLPWQQVALFAGQMFTGAISVALPMIISLLIVNITFAIMTRSAPQLNIFTIGFPITILLGLMVMLLTIGHVMADVQGYFSQGFKVLEQLMRAH